MLPRKNQINYYVLYSLRPPDDIPKQLYGDIGEPRIGLGSGTVANASGSTSVINPNIGPPPACAPPAPPKKRNACNATNDTEPHISSS